MKKSIVVSDMSKCFYCGNPNVEVHHIFFGTANRKLADKYKLVLPLCAKHHRGSNGPHQNREIDIHYKQLGQAAFELKYSREKFMQLFGKNWL